MKIKAGQFYKSNDTGEVYTVAKVNVKTFLLEHCVRDKAWLVDFAYEEFFREFTLLEGRLRDRAEILDDIVRQVDLEKLIVRTGRYVNIGYNGLGAIVDDTVEYGSKKEQELDVRDLIGDNSCSVCAIGGMFVSAVKLHNKLSVKKIHSKIMWSCDESDVFVRYLGQWFTKTECRLMEFAFEDKDVANTFAYKSNSDRIYREVRAFRNAVFKKYFHSTYSAEHMLKEIIANTLVNDAFKPGKGLAP